MISDLCTSPVSNFIVVLKLHFWISEANSRSCEEDEIAIVEVAGAISSVVVRLFAVSKILDLGETLLLVAAGRKPLLIHIFHHAITVAVVYAQYPYEISLARFATFNIIARVSKTPPPCRSAFVVVKNQKFGRKVSFKP